MHQSGRVHGDVRPANLFLESIPNHPGNLKVLFEPHVTPAPVNFAQQEPGGKLALMADYLAPELMHPGRVPDPLADIYALGCTLYCLLAGSPPFTGGNIHQKMTRHATEAIRPLEQFGVPQALAQIVAYMMAKNPTVRYQAAAIVAEQLAPLIDPSVLYLPAPQPLATLPNYENWLLQKHAHLAAQASAPQTPAVQPAFGLNLGSQIDAPGSGPASGPAIAVGASSKMSAARSPEELAELKHKENLRMLIGGLCTAGVIAIGLIIFLNTMGGKPKEPADGQPIAAVTEETVPTGPIARSEPPITTPVSSGGKTLFNPDGTPAAAAAEPGSDSGTKTSSTGSGAGDPSFVQTIVPDDGQLLWASPTTGKPVAFWCVPPSPEVMLVIRPADMLASAEGEKVIESLGPEFASQREAFESSSGLKLAEVEQLILSLHNNDAKFPRVSLVVRTKEPLSREQMLEKWGNPAEQKEGSRSYYAGKGWAYFIADADKAPNTFLMGDPIDVKEVAKTNGAPPLLRRDVERLTRATDDQRHVTAVFYPHFFFTDDGEPLFAGERKKIRQPLSWLLGDHVKAGLVSMEFGPEFYLEIRMVGSLDKEKFALASELKQRLEQVPTGLEDYFVTLTPPPYWKKIAFRYPSMISTLHANMRVGVENDEAIVNSVLPGAAAHNLVLGGELLVATAPGTAVAVEAAAPAATAKTIEDALNLKTSYSFDSQSLEFAMRDLADDAKTNLLKGSPVEFEIKIIGDDLKLDGITRNQTVRDFKQDNKTIAEILTALVMKATSAKAASDPDQKLIWVVGPDPDNASKQIVLITTRQMAEKKKYTLPAVFALKGK
jgi:hypothetical protein